MPDVQFALTPAGATTGVLDYNTKYGTKVWEDGIKALNHEAKMELTSTELYVFKKLIEKRAKNQRWVAPPNDEETVGLLDIPLAMGADDTEYVPLYKHSGRFSMEYLREYVETMLGQEDRYSQDNQMCCECLLQSLSDNALSSVTMDSDQYTVDGIESAVLMLKLIISKCEIDSPVTVMKYQAKLSADALCKKMIEVNYDIAEFNTHVKSIAIKVANFRGEGQSDNLDIPDLLTAIFQVYSDVPVQTFQFWLNGRKEEHFMGTKTHTVQELLAKGEAAAREQMAMGKWKTDETDSKIVAM